MEGFSEKSLLALGEYYVYGLIDPRTKRFFYIGKGKNNRVFEHENEERNLPDATKLKLKTIADIHAAGLQVEKIIIHYGLTEQEAFAAEAALINAFRYIGNEDMTNIASGHHANESMTAEEFERMNGAIELEENDIHHKILVAKINKLYHRDIDRDELYDAVRGVWRISGEKAKKVQYVFGVYNSLIVAVYKPSKWFVCKNAKERMPRQDAEATPKLENRLYFIDEDYENGLLPDEAEVFYLGKSIAKMKSVQRSQNPICYLLPAQ